jgi:hypothetical protein
MGAVAPEPPAEVAAVSAGAGAGDAPRDAGAGVGGCALSSFSGLTLLLLQPVEMALASAMTAAVRDACNRIIARGKPSAANIAFQR